MIIRLKNESGESITIEPGESIKVDAEKEYVRIMSTRREKFTILGTGDRETGEDAGPRGRSCIECGEINEADKDRCELCGGLLSATVK